MSRDGLFAGVAVIGFVNGISERIAAAVLQNGIAAALVSTFDISIIVWGAFAIATSFLSRGPEEPVRRPDWFAATFALMAFLAPIAPLSWLGLTGLAIYIIRQSRRASFLNRGAWILLAVTVPMFWGRLVFAALSDSILSADATLVGWIVGTPRLGNAIQFADGSGYLWIAPACSSLANVSLAILCWVALAKVFERPSSLRDIAWIVAACLAVVAINVTRISLLGLFPEHFELIHGPIGSTVASWLILAATVGICLRGVRRDVPASV